MLVQSNVLVIFTRETLCIARSLRERRVRPFVCPPVTCRYCIKTKRASVTIGEPQHSSFWKYAAHPEIRKRSPRARAMGWVRTGVFAICLMNHFSTYKQPYLRKSARRTKVSYYWTLILILILILIVYSEQKSKSKYNITVNWTKLDTKG